MNKNNSPIFQKLICFFIVEDQLKIATILIDKNDPLAIAAAVTKLVISDYDFYNLAYILDENSITYTAEYLKTLFDFSSRKIY
jgi:hypothetical protein